MTEDKNKVKKNRVLLKIIIFILIILIIFYIGKFILNKNFQIQNLNINDKSQKYISHSQNKINIPNIIKKDIAEVDLDNILLNGIAYNFKSPIETNNSPKLNSNSDSNI